MPSTKMSRIDRELVQIFADFLLTLSIFAADQK
jgi:hypothetical protein